MAQTHGGQVLTNPLQHPVAKFNNQVALFSYRDEVHWRNHPAICKLPSQQGFNSDQLLCLRTDLGLIGYPKATSIVVQRLTQAPLQLQFATDAGINFMRIKAKAIFAMRFGHIHGHVCTSQQCGRIVAVGCQQKNSDTESDMARGRFDRHGPGNRVDHQPCQPGRVLGFVYAAQNHTELVSTQAADDITGTQNCGDAFANDPEHLVAHGVSHRVVHFFEVVDIQEQQCRPSFIACHTGQGLAQLPFKQTPVGQTGDLIVQRHLLQLLFGPHHALPQSAGQPVGQQHGGAGNTQNAESVFKQAPIK
ncbi:hypothetical protein GALL_479480 [mine drainage metagenome]|uniref:Uncharacterized protein n=1 Tax=mine drainage metagenome TaxID=410659 RepID=A0A1J5PI31_9ZZZZ